MTATLFLGPFVVMGASYAGLPEDAAGADGRSAGPVMGGDVAHPATSSDKASNHVPERRFLISLLL
ncbi:MAG: hypothetical protein HY896_12935 [Deltaproteobacteria bacterium]|nr:hypothetical protein [Deltaproteobacteria bacterium]